MTKDIYVVLHTHWDYEWYFTREEAKIVFMYHMDEVFQALEQQEIDYYVLDGQMAIIDDYLTLCPKRSEDIKRYVAQGRLKIGPWYTQVDTLTTTGEAIVRNLQLGMNMAETLGGSMRIGYLPDSFGQNKDMPKIYQGFHINRTIFWRGVPKEVGVNHYEWEADDGSVVKAVILERGYYEGATWIDTGTLAPTEDTYRLLPIGGDQRPVDHQIKAYMADDTHQIPMHLATYEQFFDAIEHTEWPRITGECLDPSTSKIHRGIYDSRADIAKYYDCLERQLVLVVEPLMLMAKQAGVLPHTLAVDHLWKTLALGQAHDSAGHCNSDKTNQSIKQRGKDALQSAHTLTDVLLRKIGSCYDAELVVCNPHLTPLTQVQQLTLSTTCPHFTLYDAQDHHIPYTICEQKRWNKALLRRDVSQQQEDYIYETTIALPLAIEGLQLTTIRIVEGTATATDTLVTCQDIDNGVYRLHYAGGHLHLYWYERQQWYEDVIWFEDGGDEGDNYDYSPPTHDWIRALHFDGAQVTCRQGKYYQEMTIKGEWQLPTDACHRALKDADHTLPYTLQLIMYPKQPCVDIHIAIDNTHHRDHRLRLMIRTPLQSDNTYQDTPFGMIQRPRHDPHEASWKDIGYHEEPTTLYPFLHLVNQHDDKQSWTFIGEGQHSYQPVDDGVMAISLYRSVGYLGKPDLNRRPGDASGVQNKYIATPDSQLAQTLHFKGHLVITSAYDPVQLQQHYQNYTVPTLYYQNQTINAYTTPIQYFRLHPAPQQLPVQGIVQMSHCHTVVSSIHIAASDEHAIIVRLYNPSEATVAPGELHFNEAYDIYDSDLNEIQGQCLAEGVTCWSVPAMKKGCIHTYYLLPCHT